MPRCSHRRLWAWAVSLAAHALVLAALAWTSRPEVRTPPREYTTLVFVEPAPPPPPPPGGRAPVEPAPVPPEPEPLRRLVEPAKPKRVARVRPIPRPPEPAAPAANPEGREGGVPGGVVGGEIGGVPGSHGDHPIPAVLVATMPVVVSRVMPVYPPRARARGVEGQVLLRAVVDRVGHVEEDVEVLRSVPLLDEAAVAALRRWHFTPGRDHGGQLVRVLLEVPIRFQLR